MAHKITVQDGNIVYATSDPALSVNFGVRGQLSVTKELNVGDNPLADGVISTPEGSGVDLIITTETDGVSVGNILLQPEVGGNVLIHNFVFPQTMATPTPGKFLGASGVNVLEFIDFIIAYNPSDTLSQAQLNAAYPLARPGQYVYGPTVVYMNVGTNAWRTLTSSDNAPAYQEFVATSGQTVFNTTLTTTAKTLTKAYLQVFVNGALRMEGITKAFTVTGPNQITFNSGITLGADVAIFSFA